jgi:hypothetical protein
MSLTGGKLLWIGAPIWYIELRGTFGVASVKHARGVVEDLSNPTFPQGASPLRMGCGALSKAVNHAS